MLEILQAPEKQQWLKWLNISAFIETIFWRRETDKTQDKYEIYKTYGMYESVKFQE